MRWLAPVLLAMVVAGCASQPAPQPKVNLSGYPPSFRAGLIDVADERG